MSFFHGLGAPFRPRSLRGAMPAWAVALAIAVAGAVGYGTFHACTRIFERLSESAFLDAVRWWGGFFGLSGDQTAIFEGLLLAQFREVGPAALERTITLGGFLLAFGVVQVLALPLTDRLTVAVASRTPHGQAHAPDRRRGAVALSNSLSLFWAAALALVLTELRFRGLLSEPLHRAIYYPLLALVSGVLSITPALVRYGLSFAEVRKRARHGLPAVLGLGVVVGGLFALPLEALRFGAPLGVAHALAVLDFAALPLGVIGGAEVAMRLLEARPAIARPNGLSRLPAALTYAGGVTVLGLWAWYVHTARVIVDGKQGLYHCEYAIEHVELPNPASLALGGLSALAGEWLARHSAEGQEQPPPPPVHVAMGATLRVTNHFHRAVSFEPVRTRLVVDGRALATLDADRAVTIAPGDSASVRLGGDLVVDRPVETVRSLLSLGPREIGVELSVPLEPVLGVSPRLDLPVWRWRR